MKVPDSWFVGVNLSAVAGAITLFLTLSVPASSVLASSLSETVRQQAHQVAENTAWNATESGATVTARAGAATQGGAGNTFKHPLDAQTLSVEKQESKQQAPSALVNVYQFHYGLQQARLLVVSPDDNQVLRIQQIASVHLPLNAAEIAFASQLLAQQNEILDKLKQEQLKRGRVAFEKLAELDVKASIFEPLDNQHPCHQQRCVLLSLFDSTRTVFSTEPVINLQTLQVSLLDTQPSLDIQ